MLSRQTNLFKWLSSSLNVQKLLFKPVPASIFLFDCNSISILFQNDWIFTYWEPPSVLFVCLDRVLGRYLHICKYSEKMTTIIKILNILWIHVISVCSCYSHKSTFLCTIVIFNIAMGMLWVLFPMNIDQTSTVQLLWQSCVYLLSAVWYGYD